jgi:hypothetical protein
MKIRQNTEKQTLLNILLTLGPKGLMDIKLYLIFAYNIDMK